MTAVATICGDADPDPDCPFNVITGANEVWFTNSSTAANPVGERDVGYARISAGEINTITEDEFCAAPVGLPTMVPGTGLPFKKIVN